MRLRSLAGLVSLWFAISVVACNAYDRGRYNALVDASDRTVNTEGGLDAGDVPSDRVVNPSDADAGPGDATADGDGATDAMLTCSSCAAPQMCCGGQCVDPRVDPANCGGCDAACPGTTCSGGTCTGTCVMGRLDCDRNVVNGCEVDAAVDNNNCGACGTVCGTGRTCTAGACLCPSGTGDCDGDPMNGCETSFATSPTHCGMCGHACGANQECGAGACACTAGFSDCDGDPMNGCESDTRSDPAHCGSCGVSCGSNAACNAGVCQCNTGWLRCPATAPDCSTSANDPANCGTCGTVCPSTAPVCDNGTCSIMCAPGQTRCDTTCADLTSDTMHCGSCTTLCARPANAAATCMAGTCGFSCNAGFANCNGMAADGCEVNIGTDSANCGACGRSCTASQICSGGACTCPMGQRDCGGGNCRACCVAADCNDGNGCTADTCSSSGTCAHAGCGTGTVCCSLTACNQCCTDSDCASLSGNRGCGTDNTCSTCASGYADCDMSATNGCEANLATSITNCGTCGRVCSFAHASATCSTGTCRMGTCNSGWGDCNHNPADGCEADLNNSTTYCGRCNRACTAGQACAGGSCVTATCPSGFGNCDGSSSNGCEANLGTDAANCGACGNVCTYPNASGSCSGGACVVGACNAGFGNCDGDGTNGCETALSSSVANCGSCGNACSFPFAGASCTGGACVLGTCSTGRANCDGVASNGCEVDLNVSATNCGSCGSVCAARTNATTSCSAGSCRYTCNSGFGDCDGNATNGCETSLNTSNTNCGACGRVCAAGQTCNAGVCGTASVGGAAFRIVSLTSNSCYWVDENATCGDDRGGIAIGSSNVFYNGDNATGLFGSSMLTPAVSAGRLHDGLLSNLADGTVYALLDATGTEVSGFSLATPFTVTQLGVVNATTGVLSTTRVALSTSISVANGSGIFAGWNRVVIWNGTRAYNIDLPSGTVTDLGAMTFPAHQGCEVWAFWGTAEFYSGQIYVDYVQNSTTIARTSVPDGATTTLATFSGGLSDMCAFTYSPQRNRWYWHHEGGSSLASGASEAIGFCAGTWDSPGSTCPTGYVTCGTTCVQTANADLNCGACGTACAANAHCASSACVAGCAGGQTLCSGVCTSILSDVNNCSACGVRCASGPNSTPVCYGYGCGLTCTSPWQDCNGVASDGCEAQLGTATNCRYCGDPCTAPTGGTASCSTGTCVVTCPAGQQACGTGCVSVTADPANCGACGRTCPTGQSCLNGSCAPTTCGGGFANCNGTTADGCEADTTTDPRNCGACGRVCGSGQGCLGGVCTACNATAPRVLIYGPTEIPAAEAYLPAGSTITVATDAMWRSMTTANFASYNLIVIMTANGGSTEYQAAYDTRLTWTAAVNGRAIVQASDAEWHNSNAGAQTYLRAAFTWLTTGPGTAVYASSDFDTRGFDWCQPLGPFTQTGGGGDNVSITLASHPTMTGSTNASLSNWGSSWHGPITAFPPSYVVVTDVSGSQSNHLVLARDRQCIP